MTTSTSVHANCPSIEEKGHAAAPVEQEPTPVTGPSAHVNDLVATHAKDAVFKRGLRSFFEYRDLGVYKASHGKAIAHVIRGIPGTNSGGVPHRHPEVTFQFVYILKGWVIFEYEGPDGKTVTEKLTEGSTVYQPPGIRHREIEHSEDIEMLEIVTPGDFGSETVEHL